MGWRFISFCGYLTYTFRVRWGQPKTILKTFKVDYKLEKENYFVN